MKKCPSCHVKTIPLGWIFFEHSQHKDGRCTRCTNCSKSIRQKANFLTDLLWTFEGTALFFVLVFSLTEFFKIKFSFFAFMIVYIFFIFGLNYLKPLAVADEGYCRGDMSKIGAFFGLILMSSLIFMLTYCFIVQPFLLGKPFCKSF